jgi:3-isopropylmalate dehydrogenase
MQLVRNPKSFDVLLTSNLFGDILSDLAGMLTGSLGMLPSASLGEKHALYEPIHGSAPDIAGQNKANPFGTIGSLALCWKYTLGRPDIADLIDAGIRLTFDRGFRTADVVSPGMKVVGTQEITQYFLESLSELKKRSFLEAGQGVSYVAKNIGV